MDILRSLQLGGVINPSSGTSDIFPSLGGFLPSLLAMISPIHHLDL